MAKVPLVPIGRPLDGVLGAAEAARNRGHAREREQLLDERRAAVRAGWGAEYEKRVHEKQKLTTRERLEFLRDPGSQTFEVGTFVNHGRKFGKQASPAAGVITAVTRIASRWTMVIANDNTVASGA